jgi:tetratricopeptide (TPR) repeat protein
VSPLSIRTARPVTLSDVLQTLRVEPLEGELHDEFVSRSIDHCASLSRNAADHCVKLLIAAQRDSELDAELLEGLVLVGLAWPKLVIRHGYELVASARQLGDARLLEGDVDAARAVLERTLELFPDHRGLAQDLVVVLREADDIEALAELCMRRAQVEINAGRPLDAIPWLQEVLVSDPARRDVARTIRELRERTEDGRRRAASWWRGLLWTSVAGVLLGGLVWREAELRQRFDALPASDHSTVASVEIRLAALDAFATAHPVWHGAVGVQYEQSELRSSLARLVSVEELQAQLDEERRRRERIEADLLFSGVERHVEYGDLDLAIGDLERALELGGVSWIHRDRATRDLQAIRDLARSSAEEGDRSE